MSARCNPIYKLSLFYFLHSDCSWPQGIGNGKLPDSQISASTSFNDLHLPYHGRLGVIAPNSLGGWCPYKDEKADFLQFDMGEVKRLSGKHIK